MSGNQLLLPEEKLEEEALDAAQSAIMCCSVTRIATTMRSCYG